MLHSFNFHWAMMKAIHTDSIEMVNFCNDIEFLSHRQWSMLGIDFDV